MQARKLGGSDKPPPGRVISSSTIRGEWVPFFVVVTVACLRAHTHVCMLRHMHASSVVSLLCGPADSLSYSKLNSHKFVSFADAVIFCALNYIDHQVLVLLQVNCNVL